jgi:hypothetical protein
MYYSDLSNSQIKLSIDLQQTYEAYRDARGKLDRYAGGMTWKTVNGQDYLIKIINRRGATKSLGPHSMRSSWLARHEPKSGKRAWYGLSKNLPAWRGAYESIVRRRSLRPHSVGSMNSSYWGEI